MISKLNVLNNSNIKNRTRNKVVNIASPKLSLPRSLIAFSNAFACIRKSNKAWWRGMLTLNQSVNAVFTLKMIAYYGKTISSWVKILLEGRSTYHSPKSINNFSKLLAYSWLSQTTLGVRQKIWLSASAYDRKKVFVARWYYKRKKIIKKFYKNCDLKTSSRSFCVCKELSTTSTGKWNFRSKLLILDIY